MEKQEFTRWKQHSPFVWVLVAALLSHNLLLPAFCIRLDDQKNYYYSPDPHHSGGSHGSTPPSTPSDGGSYGGTPPSTPSDGGSYGGTPPSDGGTPPSRPSHGTPSHGYTPSPSKTPPGGNCPTPPYHRPPPTTPTPVTPTPVTPTPVTPTPVTPTPSNPPPDGGYSPAPPTTPDPPFSPTDPGTPTTPTTPTTPPFNPAPYPPITGTCNYWRNNPGLIWGILGWWGTLGSAFGVTSFPGVGTNLNLLQALSNTRTDGLGALYREGTASWLNSLVNQRFPFTTAQVRQNFVAALGSNKAATAQARLFRLANEGHLKPRA
ncbi:protodermal factor 1 [Carica papaya]|uniref:protodermal factor 1 n=1 Tax=Carica papaya TaxID=3649 RepID=UPI000B8D1851|nr:protodermal factor 1 [Carica papaya]